MTDELYNFLNRNIDEVSEWMGKITWMLEEEADLYEYAEDTLLGILDTIETTGKVTEGQKRAVKNIQNKPSNNYGGNRRW